MYVNFSHFEGTTGSDYYLRRSDTAINTLEHVVVQPYICCVTVQRLIWYRDIQRAIWYCKIQRPIWCSNITISISYCYVTNCQEKVSKPGWMMKAKTTLNQKDRKIELSPTTMD